MEGCLQSILDTVTVNTRERGGRGRLVVELGLELESSLRLLLRGSLSVMTTGWVELGLVILVSLHLLELLHCCNVLTPFRFLASPCPLLVLFTFKLQEPLIFTKRRWDSDSVW